MKTQWEYRIETIDDTGKYQTKCAHGHYSLTEGPTPDYESAEWNGTIGELGAEGWELVTAHWSGSEAIAIFKRQKEPVSNSFFFEQGDGQIVEMKIK